MFEKEIKELSVKLDSIKEEILDVRKREAEKYINVLKEYIIHDFDYWEISCDVIKQKSSIRLDFKYNLKLDNYVNYVPHEYQLFSIAIVKSRIYDFYDYSVAHLNYSNGYDNIVSFLLKRKKLVLEVQNVIFEKLNEIQEKFNIIIESNKELELSYLDAERAMYEHMISFLQHSAPIEIMRDEILLHNGIKFKNKISMNIRNSHVTADEIKFIKNPTGTYMVSLYADGELVNENKRASSQLLTEIISCFANKYPLR